jgi:hypothetical protein
MMAMMKTNFITLSRVECRKLRCRARVLDNVRSIKKENEI